MLTFEHVRESIAHVLKQDHQFVLNQVPIRQSALALWLVPSKFIQEVKDDNQMTSRLSETIFMTRPYLNSFYNTF